MDYRTIDLALVIDTFLLLPIGIGPKIALVPFVETTAEWTAPRKLGSSAKCSSRRARSRSS